MFALDLFNNDHERRLAEGAVDQLEQRRIDDLAMKMDSLVSAAKTTNDPEVKQALMKEFQKCRAERDSYYKIKDECMGYGGLTSEAGIPGNVPAEKIPGKEDLLRGRGRSYYEDEESRIVSQNAPAQQNTANDEARSWKREILQSYAKLGRMRTEAMWALENNVYMNKDQILDYVEQKSQDPSLSALEYMHDLGHDVDGLFKNVTRFLTGAGISPAKIQSIQNKINKEMGEINERRLPEEAQAKTDDAFRAYLAQKKNSETVDEGQMGEIDAQRQDLERMNERQFYTAYGMSKAAFQQKYRTLLKPALDEGQGLHQGDPVVVTAPNEFEGKTGEIAEFSPSGSFVIVDLYNHGQHSMHLSDVAYNDYADQEEADDWYDEGVAEGFQDFNKVEPYAVCLAGKPVKKFDYYEDARRFHDNWKQKLYREGNKAKADKITLMPLNLDEEEQKPAGWGEFPPKQEITIVPPKKLKSGETYQDRNKYWQSQGQAPIYKTNESEGSWIVYDLETKQIKKRFKTHTAGKSYAKVHNLGFASSEYYFDKVKDQSAVAEVAPPGARAERMVKHIKKSLSKDGKLSDKDKAIAYATTWKAHNAGKVEEQGVAETTAFLARAPRLSYGDQAEHTTLGPVQVEKTMTDGSVVVYCERDGKRYRTHLSALKSAVAETPTDYQKRRQRERDIDAGRPVKPMPKNPQTDYARKRAKEKRDLELFGEDSTTSSDAVERAILNRIMVAHTDLLMQFGPEKVMQAAEEVAYNVGDVDEIGTSDVSAYVDQVRQILGVEA